MEVENHPIEKEHHLNQTSIFGFHVNFPGCTVYFVSNKNTQPTNQPTNQSINQSKPTHPKEKNQHIKTTGPGTRKPSRADLPGTFFSAKKLPKFRRVDWGIELSIKLLDLFFFFVFFCQAIRCKILALGDELNPQHCRLKGGEDSGWDGCSWFFFRVRKLRWVVFVWCFFVL